MITDCVPIDDQTFPLLWEADSPDHAWRFRHVPGAGDIKGTSAEYHLFPAGAGVEWPEDDFERATARVVSLERRMQVRHWARDRTTDAMVLEYFEQAESFPNPLFGHRMALDRAQFGPVVDHFYALHG